jgi:hypothetical protein
MRAFDTADIKTGRVGDILASNMTLPPWMAFINRLSVACASQPGLSRVICPEDSLVSISRLPCY